MTDQPTHGWCPACKEDSAIDQNTNCLWCGGPTGQRPKLAGRQRPDLRGSLYTEPQLRALHLAHIRGEQSINSLAKQTFDKVGYKRHRGAVVAISREWKRMGLKARDRIEATVKASTKHGLAPKHGPRPGYQTYKRRVLHGQEDQPRCKGTRTQFPRKGDPCDATAMHGSEYCFSHDPTRRAEVEQSLAGARLKNSAEEMVPMAPFVSWLHQRHAELGSWSAVAESVGRDTSLVHRYSKGITTNRRRKPEIGRATVEELLEADGTVSFDDLYASDQADIERMAEMVEASN